MNVIDFLSGIWVTTFAASGLFFFKFWRSSSDRFYLLFAIACCLIAVKQAAKVAVGAAEQNLTQAMSDQNSWVYVPQLVAFVLILIAIIDRNRARKS